jgi:flavin reductase (DIM6/NTAB) family NADH-FMN oxidoreductase RutF/effector-binding domain-containing protein
MEKTKAGAFIPLPVVPTVLVGANVENKPNYLTVGFVSGVNIKPPIIGVSLNRKHHTVKGILENGTFSINIPSADYIRETDYCGLVSGRAVDKSLLFSTFYGELKTAPMIEEFPIVCECTYTGQKVDFAMDTIYFGEIIQSYVSRDLYKKGQPADIIKINPLLTGLDRQYRAAGAAMGKAFSIGWEYVSTKRAPSDSETIHETKKDAENEYRIINRSPKHALFINCGVQSGEISEAIAELVKFAETRKASLLEGPCIMRNEGLEPEAAIAVGFTCKTMVQGTGKITAGKIAGGRYAECRHIGPYETIGKTMSSFHSYIDENGFKGTGPVYEFYQNDPSVVSPDKLVTVILMPVQRKK